MKLLVSSETATARQSLRATAGRVISPGLFRALADTVRQASAQQFATGAGWAAPQDGGRPLIETGTLRDSLTRAGARFQRVTLTGDAVEIETTVPYAQYLRPGARGAPPRDPSKVDEQALKRAAAAVLMAYLMED